MSGSVVSGPAGTISFTIADSAITRKNYTIYGVYGIKITISEVTEAVAWGDIEILPSVVITNP